MTFLQHHAAGQAGRAAPHDPHVCFKSLESPFSAQWPRDRRYSFAPAHRLATFADILLYMSYQVGNIIVPIDAYFYTHGNDTNKVPNWPLHK